MSNKKSRSFWSKRTLNIALCLGPFAIFFFLFQVAPFLWVLINSFKVDEEWSLGNYAEILGSAFTIQSFTNTLWLSVISSIIAMVLSLLLVNSLRKVDCKLRDYVISFVNMSSNFSGVPLAFAFIIILGVNGALTLLLIDLGLIDKFNLYSKWGLLAIYTYFQIPLCVLLLYPAFDALKDEWHEAAQLLGANNFTYVSKVALPVLMPAIIGTFIILLANGMGAYASVYALTAGNYNVVTVRIASLVSGDVFLEPNLAAAISVLLMALLAFIVSLNYLVARRSMRNA